MSDTIVEIIENFPHVKICNCLNYKTLHNTQSVITKLFGLYTKIVISFKELQSIDNSGINFLHCIVTKADRLKVQLVFIDIPDFLEYCINPVIRNYLNAESDFKSNLLNILNDYKPVYSDLVYDKQARSVMAVYRLLNYHIQIFKSNSGIDCINNCSVCCNNENVEASVLEFMPLAKFLWDTNLAEEVLNKEKEILSSNICYFFNENSLTTGCVIYKYRALLCRLFGFSAQVKKNQLLDYYTCSDIKKRFSDTVAKINHNNENVFNIPLIREYSLKLYQINPNLALPMLPINQAMLKAVMLYGFNPKFIKNAS